MLKEFKIKSLNKKAIKQPRLVLNKIEIHK